jgi:exonuclease III
MTRLKNTDRPQHSGSGRLYYSFLIIQTKQKKKSNKETIELYSTIHLMYQIDIYRAFHPATAQYTFFSAAYGTFSKTDHILGH